MTVPDQRDKFTMYLLLALGAAFMAVGVLNLVDRLHWNDPTDGITWVEQDQGVVVYQIFGESVPSLIGRGDILLKINQHEILNIGHYTEALYLLSPGEKAVYTLKSSTSGDIRQVPVPITAQAVLSIKDFFRILVAFVYLFTGFVILIRYWHAKGSIHFYLVCLFSFSLYLLSYTNRLSALDYIVYWLSVGSLLTLPPLFLHFCINFPVRKSWGGSYPLRTALYVPSAFLLCLQVAWFLGWLAPIGLPRALSERLFLDTVHIAVFTTYFLAGIAVLFHSRITLESAVLRQQMKWIVTGTVLSLVPFAFLYVLPFLMNMEITPLMQASILSLAFLPLCFAYAIMKYRLMDVDIIFKRGAAYFIASALVLGVYFLLIGASGLLLRHIFPEANTISVAISALVVAFLFTPIRRAVQQEIDRFFYKEEYSYRQSLIEFGQSLSTESSLKTVTSTIIDRIRKSLKVDPVGIFIRTPYEDDTFELVALAGLPEGIVPGGKYRIPHELFTATSQSESLAIEPDEYDGEWERTIRLSFQRMELFYFQPLIHRTEVIGVIGLGRGPEGSLFSSEDLELLGILAGYAAIAVENARLYSSLQDNARELELMKAYSESIIEGINVGVLALSPQGTITTWNHAMEEITGRSARDAKGRPLSEVFPADFCASIHAALGTEGFLSNAPSSIYKLFLESGNEEKKFVNVGIGPFLESSGRVIGTLMVLDDITSKVQLENQLLQSEKLSSLGLIAAGVAHEVNTPLTGISSFTQMLLEESAQDSGTRELLTKIEKQCQRASQIVSNLLNFARIQSTEFAPIEVNSLLEECASLLEHEFRRKGIALDQELAPSLPQVRGNAGRLMQVFVNILLNARDATPESGRVRLSSHQSGQIVTIQIEDTGSGIPADIIHRIYDPFFTTKDTGKGTGLGLSVSHGIIQEHSGRIVVDSRPGRGTTFQIQLPALQPESQEV